MLHLLGTAGIFIWSWATLWWLAALLLRRNDIADIAWGMGFVALAGWFAVTRTPDPGTLLVYALVVIWGVRLALHIHLRNRGKGEDFRYAKWREEWGKWGWLRAYGQVFLLQGAILLVVALPILVVAHAERVSLGVLTWVGVVVWAVGLFFEGVGDWQLLRFKRDPSSKGKLMTTGLWKYTRHPNYFGEVTLWWGIWLAALGAPLGGWAVLSPIAITTLLLFVSGIPMLEAKYEGNPEWEAYRARTNAFFPGPPRGEPRRLPPIHRPSTLPGMDRPPVNIHERIERSHTLPGWVYGDPELHERILERVFAPAWQWLPDPAGIKSPGHARPFTLLPGSLDEPLVRVRGDDGELRCLSNVCTHRGALVVEGEGHIRHLRCRYHGRRFGLDGCLLSMPEFEGVEGFPAEEDHLPRIPMEEWGPLSFISLEPRLSFEDWFGPVKERMGWLPLSEFRFDPDASADYTIEANWALYCDNYLEEFHIPYVHGASLTALDYDAYTTERFRWGNLQFGIGKGAESGFDLPAGHPDQGKGIIAYYFWLFPNLMLNFYPWGLSLNLVQPLSPVRTRVAFRSWVWKEELRGDGAGADLHRVEMEDEEVVESVQRGVRSRLYSRGRFSPRREVGTHHFHHLLAEALELE